MSEDIQKGERIAKRIARAGLCSRRDAERWITDGRVQVNGKVLESAACVVSDSDEIIVDGKALPRKEHTRLFLYHKPAGLVTTARDEQGRSTVFSQLPDFLPRVVSVGRLDLNTEGLLLLTNDGGLSRYLELPETGWKRKYRVRVHGKVDVKRLASLASGITVDGVRYKGIEASIDEAPKLTKGEEKKSEKPGTNTWLSVTLREGKNREIRRVMEALGLKVNRLIRVSYGPFNLGSMNPSTVEEVSTKVLKQQCAGYFKGEDTSKHAVSKKTPPKPRPKKKKV